MSAERKLNILQKGGRLATIPLTVAVLGCTATYDPGIPKCVDDPQPKTRSFTFAQHGSADINVDGVIIRPDNSFGAPPGTIDVRDNDPKDRHVLIYSDDQIQFEGRKDGRHYAIKVEHKPDHVYDDQTVITTQADCKTPQTNP